MPLEIKVRAVPDTHDFEKQLRNSLSGLKPFTVPVTLDLDTNSKNILDKLDGLNKSIKIGSGVTSSSIRTPSGNSTTNTRDLQTQLNIQKQLSALAKQYDAMSRKVGGGIDSQNLAKVEQFLNTVRNSDGSFKTINGDLDAFNKQLKEASINAANAAAEISRMNNDTSVVSKRAKLYDQLNTAINRANNAIQQERRGFKSSTLDQYRDEIAQFTSSTGGMRSFDNDDILKYEDSVKRLAQAFRTVNTEVTAWSRNQSVTRTLKAEETALRNLTRQMNDYINSNPNLIRNREGYASLQDLLQKTINRDSSINASGVRNEFAGIRAEMQSMGLETETLGQRVSKLFGDHFNTAVALIGVNALQEGMRNLWQSVVDVDTAMTEFRKVSDVTGNSLDIFLDDAGDRAAALGSTLSDVIMATADAVKLGYEGNEAEALADASAMYLAVGDNVGSIENASASIISTLKGFGLTDVIAESDRIVSEFNEVGNKFSIGSADIGEALQRSAAALSFGNNSLEESIGLITAGFDVVQNAEVIGTSLKTLSLNLRGAKAQLEEAGEDTEGMANSLSELREELLALTGVDVMLDENTFKSTFQILKEVSEVWDSMTDIDQAAALELMGGKRQANSLAAIIENFDTAIAARDAAFSSEGSAQRELGTYLDSINGKINRFTASFQALSTSVLDSGLIKYFIDLGTSITSFADSLTDTMGGPGWLFGGAAGLFANYKDAGFFKLIDDPSAFSGKRFAGISSFLGGPSRLERNQIKEYNNIISDIGNNISGATDKLANFKKGLEDTRLGSWIDGLKGATADIDVFKKSLGGVGVASKAASIGMSALATAGNMLAGMAIGAAVNLVINWLIDLAETEKVLIQQGQEAAATYQERTTSLEEYETRVTELNESLSSGTLSYDETITARQELLQIQQAMVEQFGTEASAVGLVTQAIKGQTGAWNELRRAQLDDWKTSVSKQNFWHQSPLQSSLNKMNKQLTAAWNFRTTDIPISQNSSAYDDYFKAQQDFLEAYSDIFKITGITDSYGTPSMASVDVPSAAEWENIDVSELRESYMSYIRNAIIGEVTAVEYDALEEAALHNFDTFISEIETKVQNKVADYGETFDLAGEYDARTDEVYSRLVEGFESAESAYNEAVISGSDLDISATSDNLRLAFNEIQAVIDSDDTPSHVENYFRDLVSGIEPQINEWDFADIVENKFSSELSKVDLGEQNIYEALLGSGPSEIVDVLTEIADAAADLDLIPSIPDGEDYPVTSLQTVIDLLVELGYVEGSAEKQTLELNSAFQTIRESIQGVTEEASLVTQAINETSTGAALDLETYQALISANEDYADALEYSVGAMRLNSEAAREIANEDITRQIAQAKIALQGEAKQYRENAEAIEEYESKLRSISDSQGNIIAGKDEYATYLRNEIDAYNAQNEAIEGHINEYQLLINTLQNATSAYQLWIDAQNAPESGDMYDSVKTVMSDIDEGLTSGKLNTNAYKAAVNLAIPDTIDQEDAAAIERYKQNILERYFTFDEEDNEATATGIYNFMNDSVEKGLARWDSDGNWVIEDGKLVDDFAEALNLSADAARAIFGEMGEYAEFDWSADFLQSLQVTEEEVQLAVDDINEEIAEIGNVNISGNGERLSALFSEKYELLHPEYGDVIDEIPIKIKAQLEIQDEIERLKEELENTDDLNLQAELRTKIKELEDTQLEIGLPTQEEINEVAEKLKITPPSPENLAQLREELQEYELGNVDLSIRPSIKSDDGSVISEFSSWFEKNVSDDDIPVAVHVTPVLQSGKVLGQDEINSYLQRITAEAQTAADILEADDPENGGLGIVLRVKTNYEVEEENTWGDALNEIQAQYATMREALSTGVLDGYDQYGLLSLPVDVEVKPNVTMGEATTGPVSQATFISQVKEQMGIVDVTAHADVDKSEFDKKMDEANTTLQNFDDTSVSASIGVSGVSSARSQVQSLTRTINSIPSHKNTTITTTYVTRRQESTTTLPPISSLPNYNTGRVNGSAHASGDWGIEKYERALVGELGRELVVDPTTSRWHTVGDFGPEFVDLPKGAIVFNHLQTEDLLKHGYVSGRGRAMVSGNAYIAGKMPSLNIQVGLGNSSWSGSSTVSQMAASSANDFAEATEKATDSVKSANDAVEEYVSDLWELYRVEEILKDIQADVSIFETKLDMAQNANERIGIGEQLIDQYEMEQDALHNLAEARRELIREDISELEGMGFIIDYDADHNNLFIHNVEHINDLVGEVSGEFETAEERENALQEATNDLRKETEDMINTLIDLNDANQDAGESWLELSQTIQEAKKEIADNALDIFDSYIDYMDSFDLWVDGTEDRVDALVKKQAEINRLWELGYLTVDQYKDLTQDNQAEIYDARKDAITEIIELTMEMIRQEKEDQIDALEDQVDMYREIVDLRKEALELNRQDDDHQDEINEKLRELAKLRERINRLDLAAQTGDRGAAAEKAALEEEQYQLQKELGDLLADYTYDAQIDALDKEMEAFEDQKQDEIDAVRDSVDSQVSLYQMAIDRINNEWDSLYDDLLNYTLNYKDAISGPDSLKSAWEIATDALKEYGDVLSALQGIKTDGSISNITDDRVNTIIDQMRANGRSWAAATSQSEKDMYSAANERLAQQLSTLLGRPVVKSYDGEWYLDKVGGQKLYDVYPGNVDRDQINSLIDQMHQNGVYWNQATTPEGKEQYSLANERLAAQIAQLLQRNVVKGYDGEWYLDEVGGTRLYDVWKGTGSTPTKPTPSQENQTEAKVRSLVRDMKANGTRWANATDEDEREYYANANEKIAAQIQSLLGRKIVRGYDGVWYIDQVGGRKLYDIYHKGGIVGGIGSAKSNEVFSLLEKGELVLTDQQQKSLANLVDITSLAGKLFDRMNAPNIVPSSSGDTYSLETNVSLNVDGGLDANSARKYGEMAADIALKKIQSGFSKFGISPNKSGYAKA